MTAMAEKDELSVEDDRRTRVGHVLGLWLVGVFVGALFGNVEGRRSHMYEAIMLASLLWPVGYFLLSRCRFVPEGFSFATITALALFGLFCGLSSFVSHAPLESVQYTVLTILTIVVVLQFNTNLDAVQYEIGMKVYALLGSILLCGLALYDYAPGVRLGNGKEILNPAALALITASIFITAMTIRRTIVRIPILVAMGTLIYLTGARASAVAALIGLGFTLFARRRITETSGYMVLFSCLFLGGALAVYYSDVVLKAASDFFAIQDHHRGLESGGSGRFDTWKATWNLFLANPILGVGFRAHETVLKVNSSAHNGYLALLTEIGVIGFVSIVFATVSGLRNIWLRNQDPSQTFSYSVLLGLASGYLLLAIFERYFINAGNPTSLLFLLSILGPALSQEELEAVKNDREYGDSEAEQFVPDSLDDDVFETKPETLGVR
jgi:O-antigen ligase